MNKKGFYFTIIILFCVILMLLLSFEYRRNMTSDALRSRILTANNFVKGIERDASRAVYISGYRTMVVVMDYVSTNYKYLNVSKIEGLTPDQIVNHVFAESLFNGTLKDTLGFEAGDALLDNSTLDDWQENTMDLAKTVGLEITFSDPDPDELIVHQTSPWLLDISIPIKYNITDPISGVTWTRNTNITASLPLINSFEDPYYIISFGAGCGNKIFENTTQVIAEDCQDIDAFLDSWGGAGSRYINSTRAPSYLNRLKGNFTGFRAGTDTDPYGIESFIDTGKVSACLMLPVNEGTTVVDYRYESTSEPLYIIQHSPSRIKISSEDAGNYSIPPNCKIPIP